MSHAIATLPSNLRELTDGTDYAFRSSVLCAHIEELAEDDNSVQILFKTIDYQIKETFYIVHFGTGKISDTVAYIQITQQGSVMAREFPIMDTIKSPDGETHMACSMLSETMFYDVIQRIQEDIRHSD